MRRMMALLLVALLGLSLSPPPAMAQDTPDESVLYDRPTLVIDPGMHTAMINRASMDAQEQFLVTGSDDKTVRVWLVADGKLLRTIRVPAGPGNVGKIYAVAISPDGSTIAAGGFTTGIAGREKIYLFDRATGRLIQRLGGLPNVVHHLAVSSDGARLVATLGGANGIRIFDRNLDRTEIVGDADYGAASYGASFAADGRLATTSEDGYIRLYDGNFKLLAKTRSAGGTDPFGIAFSPDGAKLAIGFYDTTAVAILDGHTLAPLPSPDTTGINNGDLSNVAWSADGTTLYAGGRYGTSGHYPVVAWADSGRGARREIKVGNRNTVTSILPTRDDGVIATATAPRLARLDRNDKVVWNQARPFADVRGQRSTLGVSTDGTVVDFGYEAWGESPARVDMKTLGLAIAPPADGSTAKPRRDGLSIADWVNSRNPTLNGNALPLSTYERSRSLAIAPDGERFVLGTEWNLRAFDKTGKSLWAKPVPGVVWAVNISGDGRLVVAAYDDSTIRWHRLSDGEELLAFLPLLDKTNWVAWTPEGFYAATAGARSILKWHVNHGWDQAGEAVPVSEIPLLHRPDAIKLVLKEMETARALGIADMAAAKAAVRLRLGSAPGARLHVLAVGIDDYGPKASRLKLRHAAADARSIGDALHADKGVFGKVNAITLSNDLANREGILQGFADTATNMVPGEGRDVALVHVSAHGIMVDGQFRLLTHGVNPTSTVGIKANSLSAAELREELVKLAKLGKVLVILDTCHSGALGGDAVNAKALAGQLAGENITVLTASSADESARERDDLGHGVLTFTVLEALDKADNDNNGVVSVGELTQFVLARAPIHDPATRPQLEQRFDGELYSVGLR